MLGKRKRTRLFLAVTFFVAVFGAIGFNAYFNYNLQREYPEWLYWHKILWMQEGKNPEIFQYASHPFYTSPPGWKTYAVGIVFVWSYIVIMAVYFYDDSPDKHNRLKASMKSLLLILPLAISPLLVAGAKASTPVTPEVDVLMYFDEEVKAQSASGWIEGLWTLEVFHTEDLPGCDSVYERFLYNFNIKFVCLNNVYQERYDYWDSPDNLTDSFWLLQDAIRTQGGVKEGEDWVWKPQYYTVGNRKYIADLLLFVTGQDMDSRGLSPAPWNALIIGSSAIASRGEIMHELSHQFFAQHCGSTLCLMNEFMARFCSGLVRHLLACGGQQ